MVIDDDQDAELEDGPNLATDKRFRTPDRVAPTKRRSTEHADEPDRKLPNVSNEAVAERNVDIELLALERRQEDLLILSKAVLGLPD